MRRLAALLALALLAPLVTAATSAPFRLLHAELDQAPGTVVGAVDMNDHFIVTATVTNDGGRDNDVIAVNEWWYINDLPTTVAFEHATMDAGETRTFVFDVRLQPLGFSHGPLWYCLSVSSDWTARCWSLWVGAPGPQGVYPENVPNWQFPGAQYGDGPQE